jgi:hypothetical protein
VARRCAQVTLQSFLWSPRVAEKGTKAEVEALIARCHAQLQEAPAVDLAADLPATSLADLAGVMRRATCGEGGSIDASVKRVIIGKVHWWSGMDSLVHACVRACVHACVARSATGSKRNLRTAQQFLCQWRALWRFTGSQVPDRGGRPEGRARQAAMPDW